MIYLCDEEKRHLICTPYTIANMYKMAMNLHLNKRWFRNGYYYIPFRQINRIKSQYTPVSTKVVSNMIQLAGGRHKNLSNAYKKKIAS